jgi:hypothetical protein
MGSSPLAWADWGVCPASRRDCQLSHRQGSWRASATPRSRLANLYGRVAKSDGADERDLSCSLLRPPHRVSCCSLGSLDVFCRKLERSSRWHGEHSYESRAVSRRFLRRLSNYFPLRGLAVQEGFPVSRKKNEKSRRNQTLAVFDCVGLLCNGSSRPWPGLPFIKSSTQVE